ncbi:MAG: hypothetical protein RR956_03745 [Christensenella sp.]
MKNKCKAMMNGLRFIYIHQGCCFAEQPLLCLTVQVAWVQAVWAQAV